MHHAQYILGRYKSGLGIDLDDKVGGDVGGGEGHEVGELDEDALLAVGTDDLATDALELAGNDLDFVITFEGETAAIEEHDILVVG